MKLASPAPELPVRDVQAAQAYYREKLGFRIGWHNKEGRIGAVSHGPCAIFFRESPREIHPVTCWIFAEDIDAIYADLNARGANITDPLSDKPWGLRQFTFTDCNGHVFHVHHDL